MPARALSGADRALGQIVRVEQFLIFIMVLGIIVVLALFGPPLRIPIIGSIVTSIVGGIMGATSRRS